MLVIPWLVAVIQTSRYVGLAYEGQDLSPVLVGSAPILVGSASPVLVVGPASPFPLQAASPVLVASTLITATATVTSTPIATATSSPVLTSSAAPLSLFPVCPLLRPDTNANANTNTSISLPICNIRLAQYAESSSSSLLPPTCAIRLIQYANRATSSDFVFGVLIGLAFGFLFGRRSAATIATPAAPVLSSAPVSLDSVSEEISATVDTRSIVSEEVLDPVIIAPVGSPLASPVDWSEETVLDAAVIAPVGSPVASPVNRSEGVLCPVFLDSVSKETFASIDTRSIVVSENKQASPLGSPVEKSGAVLSPFVTGDIFAAYPVMSSDVRSESGAPKASRSESRRSESPRTGSRRSESPWAPSAPRTVDVSGGPDWKKPRGRMVGKTLLQGFQSLQQEGTPAGKDSPVKTAKELTKSVARTPILDRANPFLCEEDALGTMLIPSPAPATMLIPSPAAVDYSSPLSIRAKTRSRLPLLALALKDAGMSRSGGKPSLLRTVTTAGMTRTEGSEDAREANSPLGVRAEKKGPVQNFWPAKKLAKVEEMHGASLRKGLEQTRSSMTGRIPRACETEFSPGSPSARQAAKNNEEPPSPTPLSGRRSRGWTPSSAYKPPSKRFSEGLRRP